MPTLTAAVSLGGLLRSRAPRQRGRAELTSTELAQPLGQQVLEFGDRAPFTEHVPVRTHWFFLFQLGPLAIGTQRLRSAPGALPYGRYICLRGKHKAEMMLSGTVVTDLLPSSELNTCLVLETLGAETGTLQ